MNLKSLEKFGLPQTWGNGVDRNALFIIPREPVLPPSPVLPDNRFVSPSAQTITVGKYKFCYILDKTTDLYGNFDVFYNNGDPIPIFPGAQGTSADPKAITLYVNGGGPTFFPIWVTDAAGNYPYSNSIVNITYNGSSDPPTGNRNTDTTVVVNAVMSAPEYVVFPGFTYKIKAQSAQLTNIVISAPASKVYDGESYNALKYVTTNSNATIIVSYAGVSGTKYGPSATPPNLVGNYSVSISQPATTSWSAASVSATFSITPITSVSYFNFASLQAYYTGSAITASCSTTPSGLAYTVLYNGSATKPTAVGSYTVKAQINDLNVSPTATNSTITNTFNIVKSNQIASSAANSTTIVRATYSAPIGKFLVDFVGTYQ